MTDKMDSDGATKEGWTVGTKSDSEGIFKPRNSLNRSPIGMGDEERLTKRGKYDHARNDETDKSDGSEADTISAQLRKKAELETIKRREAERKHAETEARRAAIDKELKKVAQQKRRKWEEEVLELEDRKLVELITEKVGEIHKAISREVAGKISVRREDQVAVREATGQILELTLQIMMRKSEADRLLQESERNKERRGIEKKMEEMLKSIREEMDARERRMFESLKGMMTGRGTAGERVRGTGATEGNKTTDRDDITTGNGTDDETSGQDEQDLQTVNKRKKKTSKTKKPIDYAAAVKNSGKTGDSRVGKSGVEWKTPEKPANVESVVRIEGKTSKEVMGELSKVMGAKEIGGAPRGVWPMKSGGVVINWRDEKQKETAERLLKERGNEKAGREGETRGPKIEVKSVNNSDPMFRISGVEAGMSGEDVLAKVKAQNEELGEVMGEDYIQNIRVITKIKCRNPWKENWVFQAPARLFKAFVKKGRVNLELESLYVEEYFGMAMCFKCCRFGHIGKYCQQEEACARCSGSHDTRACRAEVMECVNCKRLNYRERSHSARDARCPAFKNRMEHYKKRVRYGD